MMNREAGQLGKVYLVGLVPRKQAMQEESSLIYLFYLDGVGDDAAATLSTRIGAWTASLRRLRRLSHREESGGEIATCIVEQRSFVSIRESRPLDVRQSGKRTVSIATRL